MTQTFSHAKARAALKGFANMEFMPPLSSLLLFIPAALLLAVTPGPGVMYIIARSIDQGRKAGLVSVLALATGNTVHALAAALGLSVILTASALAFDVVRYLGAAYLIYLGIRALLTRVNIDAAQQIENKSLWRIYRDGVIVGVLNPKTALFFLSFLPQFVDSTRSVPGQMLLMGLLFAIIAATTDSLYALGSGTAGQWLRGNVRFLHAQRYITGTVYIGLGLTAAFSGGHKK